MISSTLNFRDPHGTAALEAATTSEKITGYIVLGGGAAAVGCYMGDQGEVGAGGGGDGPIGDAAETIITGGVFFVMEKALEIAGTGGIGAITVPFQVGLITGIVVCRGI